MVLAFLESVTITLTEETDRAVPLLMLWYRGKRRIQAVYVEPLVMSVSLCPIYSQRTSIATIAEQNLVRGMSPSAYFAYLVISTDRLRSLTSPL